MKGKSWNREFGCSHLVTLNGPPLLIRECRVSAAEYTVFVGHGPTVHSQYLLDFCTTLVKAGWTAYAGDLRGHGGSVSSRHPLGHLDPQRGWTDLIEDMEAFLTHVFRGIPWEKRVVVGQSISGHLVLEVLKRQPMLARHIVLVSPTPQQPTLMAVARAFVKMRMMLHPSDQPDLQIHHHLYSFLGAHLKDRQHPADIVSADRATVEVLVKDPKGFPVATLGYWSSIFTGNEQTWDWPSQSTVADGTRVLLLYGSEDCQMRDGAFVPMVSDWLRARGIQDISSCVVTGARANVLIDEKRLGVAAQVLHWIKSGKKTKVTLSYSHSQRRVQAKFNVRDAYSSALFSLGISETPPQDLSSETLVNLCYAALDDEDRWSELIYTLALAEGDDSQCLHTLISKVLPHLDRSFQLKQQLLSQASMGDLLHVIVERLDIGIALLSGRGTLLQCNGSYRATLARIFAVEDFEQSAQRSTVKNYPNMVGSLTRQLLRDIDLCRSSLGEVLVVHEGHPVGLLFRPSVVRQKALNLDGPAQILVLRANGDRPPDLLHRAQLLELAYGLTRQEAVVALLVAQGKSTEALVEELSVTAHTIRTHLKRCFEKIGVSGRTELS
ncbi:MAG: alpha/beta fold hydrolase, partial [Thermostichus sp. BF3_bins_97]